MSNPTTSSGIFDRNDFLPSYIYQVRQLLHDAQANYFQDSDLIAYINEARNHAVVDTGCLRTLFTVNLPGGQEKFNFGGVYYLNDVPTPAGTPPFRLVSGEGGVATANTTTVPLTVSINETGDAAGLYYQPPIVTFDAPGMNIGATAVAEIETVPTVVATKLYGTQSAASSPLTSADQLSTSNATPPDSTTKFNAADPGTYGEMPSQGTASAWPASATIPTPSGDGFIWDSTVLVGATLQAKTWTPTLNVKLDWTSPGTFVGTAQFIFYFRVFKYNTGTYTQIVAAQSAITNVSQNSTSIGGWTNNISAAVDFVSGDQIYVDIIAYAVPGPGSGDTPSLLVYSGTLSPGNVLYVPELGGLLAINVLSDDGSYNAATVTPTVNIVPLGEAATVQDDGTGFLEIVTQGSGQDGNVLIVDDNGVTTAIPAGSAYILSKYIASVDNCTLVWNSQRMALRNMAFSDFSAALRAWVPYQNIPLAYSVYANGIYIGPVPNQTYPYELDCIIYPTALMDYTSIGQIASQAAISAVKYYAAYLAQMAQQQPQEAANFLALYAQKVSWAGNLYTTRLSQVYTDNANLE